MKTDPVSVVIPLFNRPDCIAEAIESVRAQTYPAIEIIVVDDGSTDGGPALVEAFAGEDPSIHQLRQVNAGPSAARNRGLAAARSRLVTFLDSDDLMLPGRVERQVRHLAENPEADVVIGIERIELLPGVTAPRWLRELPPADEHPRYFLMSMLLDRRHIEAVGGFDESLRVGEDVDLAVRLRAAGARIATVDEVLTVRRIRGDNLIYREDEVERSLPAALARHIAGRQAT